MHSRLISLSMRRSDTHRGVAASLLLLQECEGGGGTGYGVGDREKGLEGRERRYNLLLKHFVSGSEDEKTNSLHFLTIFVCDISDLIIRIYK